MKKAGKGLDPDNFGPFRKKCHDLVVWSGFDTMIGLVIILNGITIGVQAQASAKIPLGCSSECVCEDYLEGIVCYPVPEWVDILEWFYLVVYCIELGLRFYVFRLPVLRSSWVRLDCFLVLSAIVDVILTQVRWENQYVQGLMLVRTFRLARLARAVRLLVAFQTLWMLVQGLLHSILTLFWTFVMILTLVFIFAVLGMEIILVDRELPLDHPYNIAAQNNFRTLLDASLILLQCFCWDSIATVYRPLVKHKLYLFLYFMGVQLVLAIALMNLVTAIMVEGSLAQADEDKEAKKAYASAKRKKQMERLRDMFNELDEDGSGELTMEEIDHAPPSIRAQLVEIAGTEDIGSLFETWICRTFTEMLDYDGSGTVGTDEFCDGVIKAANGVTPVEMSRLIKQNTDILHNSRQVIALLRGEEYEGGSISGSANEDEAPKPPKRRRSSLGNQEAVAKLALQMQQHGLPGQPLGLDTEVHQDQHNRSCRPVLVWRMEKVYSLGLDAERATRTPNHQCERELSGVRMAKRRFNCIEARSYFRLQRASPPQTAMLKILRVSHYGSVEEALTIEGVDKILPGTTTLAAGVVVFELEPTEKGAQARRATTLPILHSTASVSTKQKGCGELKLEARWDTFLGEVRPSWCLEATAFCVLGEQTCSLPFDEEKGSCPFVGDLSLEASQEPTSLCGAQQLGETWPTTALYRF
eukprot:g7022.t1